MRSNPAALISLLTLLVAACGSSAPVPVPPPPPVAPPVDPRAGAACILRSASTTVTAQQNERFLQLVSHSDGTRLVTNQRWTDGQTFHSILINVKDVGWTGSGYAVWNGRSVDLRDESFGAPRAVRLPANNVCDLKLTEVPGGFGIVYREPHAGRCDEGAATALHYARYDARGAMVGTVVSLAPTASFLGISSLRYEQGRLIVVVRGEAAAGSLVFAPDGSDVGLASGPHAACARAGCVVFSVSTQHNDAGNTEPQVERSGGTLWVEILSHPGRGFLLPIEAEQVRFVRAQGDRVLVHYQARPGTAVSGDAIAVVDVVQRRVERIFDELRGEVREVWQDSAYPTITAISAGNGFFLGGGGWDTAGSLLFRPLSCPL